jgi:hypothetical protein
MRRASSAFDNSVLLPRVWPVQVSDLATLFRWRFSDGEMRDLAELGPSALPTNLTADVTFQVEMTQYRRRLFADLAGCGGWIAVAALRLESVAASQWYVLASCFTDYGRPIDYVAIFELFNNVKQVRALDWTPQEVTSRFETELSRGVQMAQWHWTERSKEEFKTRSDRLQSGIDRQRSELEQVLKELDRQILSLTSAHDADAHAEEINALRRQKASKREELLEIDAKDVERFGALLSNKLPPAPTVWRLYCLRWKVGEPASPPLLAKPAKARTKKSARRR